MRRRPGLIVVTRREILVGLRRVAVDQRPGIERVGHRTNFVFQRIQPLAAVRINDLAEAVLVLVAFLGNKAAIT